MVWEETAKIMHSLFNDVWKDQDAITVDHSHDITFKVCFSPCKPLFFPYFRFDSGQIALFVIGAAGILYTSPLHFF